MIRWNFRDATECACCATALHVFEFLFIVGPHHNKNTQENTLPVSPPVQVFAGYMIGSPCPIHRDGSASLHSDSEVCFSFVTPPTSDVIVRKSFGQHPVCTRTVTTHTAVHTGPPAGLMVITSCVTWSWRLHTSLPGTGEVCSCAFWSSTVLEEGLGRWLRLGPLLALVGRDEDRGTAGLPNDLHASHALNGRALRSRTRLLRGRGHWRCGLWRAGAGPGGGALAGTWLEAGGWGPGGWWTAGKSALPQWSEPR